jgi:ABC-2 type transport system permease protein
MLARAAQEEAIWPHVAALAWQAFWVALSIRLGASLFRKRVMKSGPQGAKRRRFWRRAARPATEAAASVAEGVAQS